MAAAALLLFGAAGAAAQAVGVPRDWSHRHLIFSHRPQARESAAAVPLSRQVVQQVHRTLFAGSSGRAVVFTPGGTPISRIHPRAIPPRRAPRRLNTDWQFTIKHPVDANMFPAKFSFDITAASCSDFVVYGTDWTGAAEPNMVGLTNLYSGPLNSSCPVASPGTNATLLFAYSIGQPIKTSVVLSLDGSKVAWVEDSNPPVFHVLKWGTTGNNGSANLAAATITPAPDIGISNNASLASVTLAGATADTNSSPFVDYDSDSAWVGTDDGILYKISGVFNGTPALVTSVTVTAGNALTGPVFDPGPKQNINRVFVGSATGDLYSVAADLSSMSLVFVGDGSQFGGIVDAPIVDATGGANGFVYVASGSSDNNAGASCATGSAVVIQVPADNANFTQAKVREACVGGGGNVNLHGMSFNDAYFSSATSTAWFLFACSDSNNGANTDLYRIGFNAARLMNTGAPTANNRLVMSNVLEECSPLTEFLNPNLAGAKDQLFLTLESSELLESFNLDGVGTNVRGNGMPSAPLNTSTQSTGTSGIIIDNQQLNGKQGSSIYFTNLAGTTSCNGHGGLHCAVKLSQSGLN